MYRPAIRDDDGDDDDDDDDDAVDDDEVKYRMGGECRLAPERSEEALMWRRLYIDDDTLTNGIYKINVLETLGDPSTHRTPATLCCGGGRRTGC